MDPVVNWNEGRIRSISYPNRSAKGSEGQQDCIIIEPTNQQDNSFNCKTYKKNKEIPATTSIILDEDSEKDECSIIDDQIDCGNVHSHMENNDTMLFAKVIDIKQLQYVKKHERSKKSRQNRYKSSNMKGHPKVIAEKNSVEAIVIEEDSENFFCKNGYNYNRKNVLSKDCVNKNNYEAIVIEEDLEKDNDCVCVTENKIMPAGNESQDKVFSHQNSVANFHEICRRDKALANLIEKCLDMENSTGMLRIINRTLIPIYIDTNEDFKKSLIFQRNLTNVLTKLDTEPNRKFLHLKTFCEAMKSRKYYKFISDGKSSRKRKESSARKIPRKKKKPIVINLDDDETNDVDTKAASQIQPCDSESEINNRQIGKNVTDIEINDTQISGNDTIIDINVETTTSGCQINDINIQIEDIRSEAVNESYSIQVSSVYGCNQVQINSNLNSINSEIYKLETNCKEDDHSILIDDEICNSSIGIEKYEETSDHDKCNHIANELLNISTENTCTIKNGDENGNNDNDCDKNVVEAQSDIILIEDVVDNSKEDNKTTIPSQHNNIRETPDCDSGELVPLSSQQLLLEHENNCAKKLRIKYMEDKIGKLNALIKSLESDVVDWDHCDGNSAYIMCESYKSALVDLYKELCSLNGTECVKRRKVRLKVQEGHPEGPVKCLEQFINSNIDENGDPPFPDMHDVIKCVEEANTTCNLGWSSKDIIMEARALFIHYGRTVQKKRMKREWRHLMRYVEKEDDVDPADEDSMLEARLKKNAELALKNEKDLLDRYAVMDEYNRAIHRVEGNIEPLVSYRRIPLRYNVEATADAAEGHSKTVVPCNGSIRYDPVPDHITGPSNVTAPNTGVVTNIATEPSDETLPNNFSIRLNTYKETCGGDLTNNIKIFKANCAPKNVVLSPPVVTYPLPIAVNQNIMLSNIGVANDDWRELPNYSNTVDSTAFEGTSNERNYINPDISSCNAVIDNNITTNMYSNVSTPLSEENDNSEINDGVANDDWRELPNYSNTVDSTAFEGTSNERNYINPDISSCNAVIDNNITTNMYSNVSTPLSEENDNSEINEEVDIKPCITVFEGTHSTSVQDNEISTNFVINATNNVRPETKIEESGVSSSAQVRKKDFAELSNDATSSNTVKREPLDIPRMLKELGDNYTVSIMDIEDPFEIIEISDSSDSEQEEDDEMSI